MRIIKMAVLCALLITAGTSTLLAFNSIEDAYKNFAATQNNKLLLLNNLVKKVDNKNNFIEYTACSVTIQFAKYGTKVSGEDVYVFNCFADTSFNQPGISLGCYKYINNAWVEVTDETLPLLKVQDFFAPDANLPKVYNDNIKFRLMMHSNSTLHIIMEPSIAKEDATFDKLYDARKYAAVLTKWNSNTKRFEINKWLK